MVGQSLGHYEIREPLGSGGMGDVYRAHDTTLDRDVAIKVLPEDLADDSDRLARLRREAHLLAALNHPNVATIHGYEESEGTRFLVMELVRGESLEQRLAAGQLPVDEALDICRQIAEALEAAHEEGIIHRDLKPANVMITPEGRAKVLDFGLAKTVERDPSGTDLSHSPTITIAGTEAGVILGTAPYMSPEQVRGKALDKRTDIWAFGCVLYETLSGSRAFNRETVADTLAAILDVGPPWDALPDPTPVAIQSLLRRCLNKDPDRRLHDIADARIEIEESLGSPESVPTVVDPQVIVQRKWARAVPWVVTAIAILIAIGAIVSGQRNAATTAAPPTQYLEIGAGLVTEGIDARRPAISPDGTRIAYVGRVGGERRLLLRSVDREDARLVPGTEGVRDIFFSSDGDSVAFRTPGEIRKVSFAGGSPSTICRFAPTIMGGSWGPDDTIYFGTEAGGIYSVPASGGDAIPMFPPDREIGENYLVHPEVLPGGKAMLYDVSYGGRLDDEPIFVIDFETNERRKLVEQGSTPQYASSGHIVFARRGQLLAVSFDLERLEASGEPRIVLDGVYVDGLYSVARYDISQSGTLLYISGEDRVGNRRLILADREGSEELLAEDRDSFVNPTFSPDGRQVAVSNLGGEILIYSVERGGRTRLNFPGISLGPVWTPDGDRIAFSAANRGPWNVFWGPIDGTEEAMPLWESDNTTYAMSWSADGQLLAIEDLHSHTGYDISILSFSDSEMTREPYLNTEFDEVGPMFSPAGPWIAYHADYTGEAEVYVEPYPRTGDRFHISTSTQGGRHPIWAKDGSQLYYWAENTTASWATAPDLIMAVDIRTEPEFSHSPPRIHLEGAYAYQGNPSFDVAPDGRLVLMRTEDLPQPTEFQLVLNWFEELKRLVPGR